jgi:hypothetical protein
MARRHLNESVTRPSNDSNTSQSQSSLAAGNPDDGSNPPERHAMRGRLQEIDLGDEARRRNETMTEQAKRRLDGGQFRKQMQDSDEAQKKAARLGPDGKPWRGRKRRASQDAKRDELVEAVMRENRSKSPGGTIPTQINLLTSRARSRRRCSIARSSASQDVRPRSRRPGGRRSDRGGVQA